MLVSIKRLNTLTPIDIFDKYSVALPVIFAVVTIKGPSLMHETLLCVVRYYAFFSPEFDTKQTPDIKVKLFDLTLKNFVTHLCAVT